MYIYIYVSLHPHDLSIFSPVKSYFPIDFPHQIPPSPAFQGLPAGLPIPRLSRQQQQSLQRCLWDVWRQEASERRSQQRVAASCQNTREVLGIDGMGMGFVGGQPKQPWGPAAKWMISLF